MTAAPLYLERQLLCAYAASEFELRDLQTSSVPHLGFDDFVSGAEGFFATKAKQPAIAGSPYVADPGDFNPQEFTAEIRITGARRGAVYVSASRAMLTILLMRMGSTDITTATMSHALRSIAESMVNAARPNLSNELMIWSPTVTVGGPRTLDDSLDARTVVAPLHWRRYTLQVAVCVE